MNLKHDIESPIATLKTIISLLKTDGAINDRLFENATTSFSRISKLLSNLDKPKVNLLVVAMDQEINSIHDHYNLSEIKINSTSHAKCYLYSGNSEWVIIKSGVGPINTSLVLSELNTSYQIQNIIQFGVGGSLSESIDVGDYVLGSGVIQHDAYYIDDKRVSFMGTGQLFISREKPAEYIINCNKPLTEKLETFCNRNKLTFSNGLIASGSSFIAKKDVKSEINNRTNAVMVEMESASVSFFADENTIPYAFIKVCSDSLNDESQTEYKDFMKQNINIAPKLLGFLDESI